MRRSARSEIHDVDVVMAPVAPGVRMAAETRVSCMVRRTGRRSADDSKCDVVDAIGVDVPDLSLWVLRRSYSNGPADQDAEYMIDGRRPVVGCLSKTDLEYDSTSQSWSWSIRMTNSRIFPAFLRHVGFRRGVAVLLSTLQRPASPTHTPSARGTGERPGAVPHPRLSVLCCERFCLTSKNHLPPRSST